MFVQNKGKGDILSTFFEHSFKKTAKGNRTDDRNSKKY